MELPVFNYKGYRALSKSGEMLSITDGKNNVVRILIPDRFDDDVSVRFTESFPWKIANFVSVITVFLVVALWFGRDFKTSGRMPLLGEATSSRFNPLVKMLFFCIVCFEILWKAKFSTERKSSNSSSWA